MAAPSPYETDVQPTDSAKAFAIGQSLSRVWWHLVQRVFLDDYYYYLAPIPGAVTAKRHGQQWRAAAMSIRARLEFNVHPNPDRNRPDLDAAIDAIEKTLGSEYFADALFEAEKECVWNEWDRNPDEVRSEIVHYWLTPLSKELQEAASYGFSDEQLRWMKLGRILDECLCRPDVIKFLTWPEGPDILRVDPYWAAQKEELAQLPENWHEEVVKRQKERQDDSIDAGGRPIEHLRGFASRQPGDLWLKPGWSDDVRRLWALAEIDNGQLALLDELLSLKGSKEWLTEGSKEELAKALRKCVDQLSHAAHSAALLCKVTSNALTTTRDGRSGNVTPVAMGTGATDEAEGQQSDQLTTPSSSVDSAGRTGQTEAGQPPAEQTAKQRIIPDDRLSKLLTKDEAAKLHAGHSIKNPTAYFARLIKQGKITAPVGETHGHEWRFYLREFPEGVHDIMLGR